MKKRQLYSILLCLALVFSLGISCGCFLFDDSENESQNTLGGKSNTYNVKFIYNNGTSEKVVQVKSGYTVATPDDPTKTNYTFTGWYTDSYLYSKYDFSQPVTSNLTLYAGYELDAVKITNEISLNTIKSIVKIYNKSYNTFLGITTSYSISQGSGFCFRSQSGYYYILTNCHVAKKNPDYSKQEITVEDYRGNTYTGYIYKNSNKSYDAISANYDLACIYFKSSSTNVKALNFGSSDPTKYDDIISLGAPHNQTNFITYGKVNNYRAITLNNTSTSMSNVKFNVIEHTAYIDGGSSGGPLLNTNLQVIGVNYAGTSKTANATYYYSYSIPVSKVQEFLRQYVYN